MRASRFRPVLSGGNQAVLLRGGDAQFPAMAGAIDLACREVWLATYIYADEGSVTQITQALVRAAQRGVKVRVVVDGFGSHSELPHLQAVFAPVGVELMVFRPIKRWWNWLQPSQLRRQHQKLCAVDDAVAFVGGINLIDDRFDQTHGWSDTPRLDFAVRLQGPVVSPIKQATRALWTRAKVGRDFRQEFKHVAHSAKPVEQVAKMVHRLRLSGVEENQELTPSDLQPVRVAFVMRDNLRRRRSIERSYIDAIRGATQRVDLISPYFYPDRTFLRVLRQAAQRGVRVRLLLQGKIDYRIAALAAQALYDDLLMHGVQIFEYTPAFLHAKVALVDDHWATVGSSNIDPISLLLNLEANVVLQDITFNRTLAQEFEQAVAVSEKVDPAKHPYPSGLRGVLRRAWVAWGAHVYLRIAGAVGRY